MSERVRVVATLPEYRVAVAGLPHRAEASVDPNGAIVVVDGGERWWDAAAGAVDDGARAVLIVAPGHAPADEIDALAARSDVPVLVHRPRLRHDLVAGALAARSGAAPRVVVAECRAEPADLPALVRDAVGWLRVLVGRPVDVAATGGAVILRAAGGAHPVGTLLATASTAGGPVLRVRALGETTTELELDDASGRRELITSTAAGRTSAPALHESGPRAALRRTLDLLGVGGPFADLTDLRHDATAADLLTRT